MTGQDRACPVPWCTVVEPHGIHRATLLAGRGLTVGIVQGPDGTPAVGLTLPGGTSATLTAEQARLLSGGIRRTLARFGTAGGPVLHRPTAAQRARNAAGGES